MTGNLTITATFTQDSYTLTIITVGEGTVQPSNQTYLSGTAVNINATNAGGWAFTGWSGDATGSGNTTITMTGNLTIPATFTQDLYTLPMIPVGNGTVQPSNQTYLSGTTVNINATNLQGWEFGGWSGDATRTTNTTITMTGNLTVTAVFVRTYNLTCEVYLNAVYKQPLSGTILKVQLKSLIRRI
jgi:uncharacterized repeat protein (TIGR02543 family)